MDTAERIQNCIAGNEEAIEGLVQAYQRGVYHLALSILDGPGMTASEAAAEAEEATQDVFLAALHSLHSYQGKAAFSTWLYAITLNICRNRYRKRQALYRLKNALRGLLRQPAAAQEAAGALERPERLSPEEDLLRREADGALWKRVSALGEKHRVVVILRYYHDFPVAEIAQMLGISEGTVHSRLYTARERLRDMLEEASPGQGERGPRDEFFGEKTA